MMPNIEPGIRRRLLAWEGCGSEKKSGARCHNLGQFEFPERDFDMEGAMKGGKGMTNGSKAWPGDISQWGKRMPKYPI